MDVVQILSRSSYCLLAASAFIMAYFSVLFFFSTFFLTNTLEISWKVSVKLQHGEKSNSHSVYCQAVCRCQDMLSPKITETNVG